MADVSTAQNPSLCSGFIDPSLTKQGIRVLSAILLESGLISAYSLELTASLEELGPKIGKSKDGATFSNLTLCQIFDVDSII